MTACEKVNQNKNGKKMMKGAEMNTIMHLYGMLKDRKGATMAEYAVIAAVLILVAIVAFTSLGSTIVAKINDLVSNM
jgi:Flp pilus assembly pilin Flp